MSQEERNTTLAWEEAPRRLEAEQGLVPALTEQLREAEALQQTADEGAAQAETQYDAESAKFLSAESRRDTAKKAHDSAAEHVRALDVPDPTAQALAATAAEVAQLEQQLASSGSQRDALLTDKGGQACGLFDAQQHSSEEKLANERREAEPARKRWEDLFNRAMRGGLVGKLLISAPEELNDIRGHINLVQQANTRREVLLERLRGARGGEALLTEMQLHREAGDSAFAEAILEFWLAVRDWLRRRLPAQVAEVDDPREALVRLHEQLGDLEERLVRQESELRGASEDVAHGIGVQIRKARGQVGRLTSNLETVSFGGIQGIRVRMEPVERMEQVLRALREGAAQELLFQANMPIEDALNEIFRRYGGGRSGGQRLPLSTPDNPGWPRRGQGQWSPYPRNRLMWQTPQQRIALLELLTQGLLKRRASQADAYDTLAELSWTRATGRRSQIGLVEAHRSDVLALLGRVWPEWEAVLAQLAKAGIAPTPDGWAQLEDARRAGLLPALPARLNRRTAAALAAPHSKANLTPRRQAALAGIEATHDGLLRMRPPRGLVARTAQDVVDLWTLARALGEAAIPERAFLDGLKLEGFLRAVLLVENAGAWRDLPMLEGWLVVHVPGWDIAPTGAT